MFNVGEQLALGGTLSLKTLGEGYIGVHGRLRWWLEDDWGYAYENRIFAVPLLSLLDVDQACAELDRVQPRFLYGHGQDVPQTRNPCPLAA